MAAAVPPAAPWSAPKAGAVGRRDLRLVDAAQRPHRGRSRHPAAGDHRRLGCRASRSLAAARPLLHPLGRLARDRLTDTEGGAQQDRVVGGSQLIALRIAEELGATVVELDDPGAARSARRRRSRRSSDRADRPSADAGRSSRSRRRSRGRIAYDPPLPAVPRRLSASGWPRAAWSSAWPIYERPFWRERGLSGRGHERQRPGLGRLRQLAARRFARRPARLPRGRGRARGDADLTADERRRARRRLLRPLVRARGRRPGRLRRPGLGRGRVVARLLRRLHADRRLDRLTARPCEQPIGPIHWAGCRDRDGLERLHGRRGRLRARTPPQQCSRSRLMRAGFEN